MEGEEVDRVVSSPILKRGRRNRGTVLFGLLESGGATQKAG